MATKPLQFKLVLTHIGLVSHACEDETVVIPLLMTHCVTNSSVSIIASGDTGMEKASVEIRPLLGFYQSGNNLELRFDRQLPEVKQFVCKCVETARQISGWETHRIEQSLSSS